VRKNISAIILSILLIVPIFYVALCILFDLPITSSFNVLNELYTQSYILERALKVQVYIAAAYSILPLLFTIMTIIAKWKKSIYGYAAFATFETIKKMELNFKKGFTLCLFKGKPIKSDDTRSTLVIAAPGTGKTSSIVVPNLLSIPTSALILDIKGGIEKLTSRYRKEVFKNEIFIFNPFGKDNNFHFNPFAKDILKYLDFDERMSLIKQTANVLFKKEKGSDSHWVESARTLFIFFAIYDIEKNGETNLFKLMRFPKMSREELLDDEVILQAQELEETEEITLDDMKLFFTQVSSDMELDELVRDMARANDRTNQKEYRSIVTTYARKLEVFTDYRVKDLVESMSFEYEDLRKKNITLYIKVNEKDIDTLSPLIGVILETIGKELLTYTNNNKDERIDFYLDEFVRFGQIPFLLELPTISREYNMPGTYLVQTSAQVQKYYSLEDLKIISGACAYNVIFTLNDNDYAKMISESIGNLTRDKASTTSQFSKAFGSTNKSDEGYALLTPQDLMNIPKNEVIISVFGHKATPIKGKINYYFKNRSLKKIIKKYSKKEK
jgi:type IV secretion system protein VirD4